MSADLVSARTQEWVNEIDTTGRVAIRHRPRTYLLQFGVPVAVVIVLFVYAAVTGRVGTVELVFGVVFVPIFFLIFALIIFFQHKGKELVIDRGGITTLDGHRFGWHDVSSADVFRSSRSRPTVRILVSDSAWQGYLASRSILSRALNEFNSAVSRKNGIYLPPQLGADPDELAALINFFASNPTN